MKTSSMCTSSCSQFAIDPLQLLIEGFAIARGERVVQCGRECEWQAIEHVVEMSHMTRTECREEHRTFVKDERPLRVREVETRGGGCLEIRGFHLYNSKRTCSATCAAASTSTGRIHPDSGSFSFAINLCINRNACFCVVASGDAASERMQSHTACIVVEPARGGQIREKGGTLQV